MEGKSQGIENHVTRARGSTQYLFEVEFGLERYGTSNLGAAGEVTLSVAVEAFLGAARAAAVGLDMRDDTHNSLKGLGVGRPPGMKWEWR